MTQRDESATTARVAITLDGYATLAESTMTISDDTKAVKGTWVWNIPFGIGGGPHFIGVRVDFR